MRRTTSFLAAAVVLGFGSLASASNVYNLAGDYSITNNGAPNNNWSYGSYTAGLDPTSFSKFTTPTSGVFGSLDVWANSGSDPNIEKNTGGSDNNGCCGITWPAGQVAFGPFQGPTVARFTVPASGTYDLSSAFQYIQSGNTAPDAYVYDNATQLAHLTGLPGSTAAGGDGSFATYSTSSLSLTAGDTLDFVVWGNNANNKTTQVQATVTQTAVPEPASFVLAGSALIGLAVAGLRRVGR